MDNSRLESNTETKTAQQIPSKPGSSSKPSHTERLRLEREKKKREQALKEEQRMIEIEAKIQKARERIAEKKAMKSLAAKTSLKQPRSQNDDLLELYAQESEGQD